MPASKKKDKIEDVKGHSYNEPKKSVNKPRRSKEDDVKGHSFSDRSVNSVSSVSSVNSVSGTKSYS
jgi:hypothetical protein